MENTALFETSRPARISPFDRPFPSRNLTAFSTNSTARGQTWNLAGTNLNSIWNSTLDNGLSQASPTRVKLDKAYSTDIVPTTTLLSPSETPTTSTSTWHTAAAHRLSSTTSKRPVRSPTRPKAADDRSENEVRGVESAEATSASLLSGSSPDIEGSMVSAAQKEQILFNNPLRSTTRDNAYTTFSSMPKNPLKPYHTSGQTQQLPSTTAYGRPLNRFASDLGYHGIDDSFAPVMHTGGSSHFNHDPARNGPSAQGNSSSRPEFQQGYLSDFPSTNAHHDTAIANQPRPFARPMHDFILEGQDHYLPVHEFAQHKAADSQFSDYSSTLPQWPPRLSDEHRTYPSMPHHLTSDYPSQSHPTPSFGERGSATTMNSDYRGSLQSPYHSTSATPPTGPESVRSTSMSMPGGRSTHGHLALVDRKLRSHLEQHSHDQQSFSYSSMSGYGPYKGQHEYQFSASSMRMNPLARPYVVPSYRGYPDYSVAPTHREYEDDRVHVERTPLLEDFRANVKTNNKKYDLKDIYNHVVEFSGDQHGSRFIQQKLETANSDEKDQLFAEIQPNAVQLMQDVFGNYVIQKIFEHGSQSQKKVLGAQMKGKVHALSLSMYGCRVVQKALEHVLTDQQASMVKELEGRVLGVIKDQNGNHVVQKAIECVPAEHVQFIVDAHKGRVRELATHTYGCRVIQRMLEFCQEPAKRMILAEIHDCISQLIVDPFGNYVIQHVIVNGDQDDRHDIVHTVQDSIQYYAKHKFGSNVVEKSIEHATDAQRHEMFYQLLGRPERPDSAQVFSLMRDQFGNYVIQKVVSNLMGAHKAALLREIREGLVQLKRFSYGKQVTAMEKLLHDNQDAMSSTSSASSTLPSTNASSTIEDSITPPALGKHPAAHETRIALPATDLPS